MTIAELTADVLALPLAKQVTLAQTLWAHINEGLEVVEAEAAAQEAARRDREMSAGRVTGRSHREVMQAARRALKCS